MAALCNNFSLDTNKTCFDDPSKLPIQQACHNYLREATHNTIIFMHFQVPVYFMTTPNIVFGPSPC